MMRVIKNGNFLQLDEIKIKNPSFIYLSFVEKEDEKMKKKEGVLKGCLFFLSLFFVVFS